VLGGEPPLEDDAALVVVGPRERPLRELSLRAIFNGDASTATTHDRLDLAGTCVERVAQHQLLVEVVFESHESAHLRVGELAALERRSHERPRREALRHPDVIARRGDRHAAPPRQPVCKRSVAVVGAQLIQLAEEPQPAPGRRADVRGELRRLIAELSSPSLTWVFSHERMFPWLTDGTPMSPVQRDASPVLGRFRGNTCVAGGSARSKRRRAGDRSPR
jgi:hypothetical protein